MAVKICQTILRQRTLVSSMEKVEMLLDFISPLVKDTEGLEDDDEVSQCCCTILYSIAKLGNPTQVLAKRMLK